MPLPFRYPAVSASTFPSVSKHSLLRCFDTIHWLKEIRHVKIWATCTQSFFSGTSRGRKHIGVISGGGMGSRPPIFGVGGRTPTMVIVAFFAQCTNILTYYKYPSSFVPPLFRPKLGHWDNPVHLEIVVRKEVALKTSVFGCSMLVKVWQQAMCCKVSAWYVSRNWVPAGSPCVHRRLATISSIGHASTVTSNTVAESSKNVGRNAKASVIPQQRTKFLKYA